MMARLLSAGPSHEQANGLVDVAAKMLLNKVFQKLKEKVEERLQE